MGFHQRKHSRDKGDGSHQNRTEPQAAGFDGSLDRRFAFVLFAFGKFHDQDRVLASKTYQDDKTDLSEYVVVTSFEPDPANGKHEAHRDNKNNRQWQPEALVLRGEYQKHQ